MKDHSDTKLDERLKAYAETVRTVSTNSLKRSAEKWPVYAAVTGAAIAMASSASADVIFSGFVNDTLTLATGNSFHPGPNTTIRTNSKHFSLGDGFKFQFGMHQTVASGAPLGGAIGMQDVHGFYPVATGFVIKRLSSGAKISASAFAGGTYFAFGKAIALSSRGNPVGGWAQTNGLAGFDLFNSVTQQLDYGWIRLQYVQGSHVTAIDWAYDNTGAAILAGQGEVAPEPSSFALATPALMLLAAGAAGVEALRRRRKSL